MRKILACLVAVMFIVMTGGTAFAAWTTGSTLQTVLVTGDSSKLKPVATSADPIYTTVAGEILAANDTITITLTGGAKFSGAAVTLKPSATVDLGAGVAAAAVPISGGIAGSTSATWRVVIGGGAVGVTYTLNTLTVPSLDVTGVVIGGNVDLVMTMTTLGGLPILTSRSHFTAVGNYLYTGAASEVVTLTARTDTADVAATTGAFTQFTGPTLIGTATVLSIANSSGAATLPTNLAMAAQKILFSLVGDFTGIASVSGTGCTGSSSAGSITGGLANFFLIGTGAAYCVNTAAVAAGATLALAPVFRLNGTTAQAARTFTAKVENLGEATNWLAHVAKDTTTLFTIIKNGVTRHAYNIPNSANVDGAFVRIINTSNQAGKVIGTMYNEAGALIGTASTELIASIAPNSTSVINATDLETRFGTWTGRARLTIDAEVPSMEAYCLVRAANGTLTNMSSVTP